MCLGPDYKEKATFAIKGSFWQLPLITKRTKCQYCWRITWNQWSTDMDILDQRFSR